MNDRSRWDPIARGVTKVSFCLLSILTFLVTGGDLLAQGVLGAAATDLVDLNSAMKILFEDSVFDNTVHDSELMEQFEMDDRVMVEETTGGRYIETAQYFQLPAGVRAVASGDYIPVPDGPVIENSRVYLKKVQGTVEMLGDVMRRVRTNEGAFLDWGDRALPDLVARMVDLKDRMMLGYGAGILGRVAAADTGAGTTLLIDRNHGVTALTGEFLNFLEGKRIVFSAAADGDPLRVAGAGQSAQVLDATDGQLVLSARPTGVVTDDYIFEGDDVGSSVPAGSQAREFMGLLGMVDDGGILPEFQEITRSEYRKWQSVVIDGTTGDFDGTLTEDLITYADDQTFVLGAGKINLFVTSRAGNRTYWRSLRNDRTINDPDGRYVGGVGSGPKIILGDRNVPIKVARKMPPELAFGLQTNTFKRWQLGRWEWDDTTGSIWNRATDNVGRKDAYYAVGHLYIQMGCFAPRKNFRLDALVNALTS